MTPIVSKYRKVKKTSTSPRFYATYVYPLKCFGLRMLETFQNVRTRYPIFFFEEIFADLWTLENISKMTAKFECQKLQIIY